jgi:hypothetical protein
MRLALLLLPLQIWGQVDLSLTTSETGWTVTCESGEANQIVMGIHAVGLDTAWLPGLSDVWHIGWAFASFPANISVMETWSYEFEDVFNPNFQNLWNLRDSVCVELVIWQIDGSQTLHTWDSPYGWTNGPSAANDTPPYPDPTPWNNRVTECFCYDVVDVVYDYDTLYFPYYVIIVQTEYDTLYQTIYETDTLVITETLTDTLYVQQLDTLVVTDTVAHPARYLVADRIPNGHPLPHGARYLDPDGNPYDTLWLTETDTLWLMALPHGVPILSTSLSLILCSRFSLFSCGILFNTTLWNTWTARHRRNATAATSTSRTPSRLTTTESTTGGNGRPILRAGGRGRSLSSTGGGCSSGTPTISTNLGQGREQPKGSIPIPSTPIP